MDISWNEIDSRKTQNGSAVSRNIHSLGAP